MANVKSFEEANGNSFGDILSEKRVSKKAKIGLFTGGYFEYWRMFPETLEKNVTSDMERVKENFKKKFGNVVFSGWQMIGFTLLCGLVTTVLPYMCYNFGLKHVENGKAAVIASVEPAVATLLGVLVFQETLTVTGVIGLLMVIGAIVVCQRKG